MLVHADRATSQGRAPAHWLDLQAQILNAHRVVAIHGTLELQCKDQIEVLAAASHKRTATLGSLHLKASIELSDIVFAQKAIGRLQTANSPQPQLLRQPSLPSAEITFGTAAGLRRIGGYHLHSQLAQRSTYLRQAVGIDLASRLRGEPEMAAAIAVQSTENALALDDFLQPRHHRERRFFLGELRVVNLAGGIVQDHNQVIPAFVLKPLVMATVDVQQHAWQWTALPPLAMHPAFAGPCYQPSSLQRGFHPRVAQIDLVFGLQLLVKMADVEIEILLSIQPEDRFHRRQGNSLRGWLATTSVKQPVVAKLLVTFPNPAQMSIAKTQNLGRLEPGNLPRHRPQQHLLYLHRPLHSGLRVTNHAFDGLLLSPPAKRTYHVLIRPDI